MTTLLTSLVVAAAAPTVDPDSAALLTSAMTAAASSHGGFDVVSSEDLRRTVELEGTRRAVGCDDAGDACLAEVAQALGASLVLYGEVGSIGDQVVLSLNLFDGARATSVGRRFERADDVGGLLTHVPIATKALLDLRQTGANSPRERVLVLDLKRRAPGGAAAAKLVPAEEDQPLPWLLIAGGLAASLGVGSLVAGIVFDQRAVSLLADASDKKTSQLQAKSLIEEAQANGTTAVALYVGAAAFAVVGGALAAVHVFVPSDAPAEENP